MLFCVVIVTIVERTHVYAKKSLLMVPQKLPISNQNHCFHTHLTNQKITFLSKYIQECATFLYFWQKEVGVRNLVCKERFFMSLTVEGNEGSHPVCKMFVPA